MRKRFHGRNARHLLSPLRDIHYARFIDLAHCRAGGTLIWGTTEPPTPGEGRGLLFHYAQPGAGVSVSSLQQVPPASTLWVSCAGVYVADDVHHAEPRETAVACSKPRWMRLSDFA